MWKTITMVPNDCNSKRVQLYHTICKQNNDYLLSFSNQYYMCFIEIIILTIK